MKRSVITSSLAALSLAFLLPMGAQAATTATNATAAKHATAAKTATAAQATTTAKTASTAHKTEGTTPAKTATATKSHHKSSTKNASASKKIDINTATKEELMTLPGMTDEMADKIIAGRPYKNSAQLKTKGGVTTAEFRKISRKVTARQSAMHSEAPQTPAGGTQNSSGTQNAGSGEGAAGNATGSSDQTTK